MTAEGYEHRPVLLNEAIDGLNIRAEGLYVDGTYGRGGHAEAIVARLGPDGRLWVFDRDQDAVAHARARFAEDGRCLVQRGSYAELAHIARRHDVLGRVDGVLLDLGVSSPQLDDPERGFSFLRPGPLDMRMDTSSGESAAQWLAGADEKRIATVLWEFGEERYSRRIARAIVAAREAGQSPRTTTDLVQLIERAVPSRERHKHPATRSFQAIRIYVNGELDELERLFQDICEILAPRGRLVVISFHSLEDRIVKRFMRGRSRAADLPPSIPVPAESVRPRMRVVGKALRASEVEVRQNARARSAVLRVAERLP